MYYSVKTFYKVMKSNSNNLPSANDGGATAALTDAVIHSDTNNENDGET